MPSLPPLLSDSQLCMRWGVPPHAWHMIGLRLGCAAPLGWARVVWLRPAITAVPRRGPAHSPPQRR